MLKCHEYNDIFHKFSSKGESIRYSVMISRNRIVHALDIGIWKSSNVAWKCGISRVHTVCKLVFIAIVYMRLWCVGNLIDIDLFNLIPCNFQIMHVTCFADTRTL